MSITPFRIDVSDEAIADLKERLTMTRWPHATTTDWSHGQPVGFIKELADQWLNQLRLAGVRGASSTATRSS